MPWLTPSACCRKFTIALCPKENLLHVKTLLLQQKDAASKGAAGLTTFLPLLLQSESEMLKAIATLTKRSGATIPPIFTPDFECADFYRWPVRACV